MDWITNNGSSGLIMFCGYLLLYGLEYFFPLARNKSRHLLTNVGMTLLLLSANVIFTSVTFGVARWVETNNIGLFNNVSIATVWAVAISILVLDFWSGYVAHLIFHKSAFLWKLHIIHHSDDHVDVTTTFRQHPVEGIIRIFFNLTGLIALGIPLWMLLLYLTLSTIHAQFEHANIRLPEKLDRILQRIIVTPNMHKVHHSRFQVETDTNYSNIFSIWDRLFRTYSALPDYANIEYGLDTIEKGKKLSLWELVISPFRR